MIVGCRQTYYKLEDNRFDKGDYRESLRKEMGTSYRKRFNRMFDIGWNVFNL